MNKLENIYFLFLLLIVLIFGLYIRFDDIKIWQANKEFYFYKNNPLYSEYDSFYFARLAQDIKEGIFKPGEIDNYRFFPDNSSQAKVDDEKFYSKYTIAGTFISWIWAHLSSWFNISLEKLTWYLIPILAISVAFPIFFYFKDLGYPYAGLIGSLIAVSAPMYLARTNLMRLDHDVFNLTWPFLIAYIFYKFFQTTNKKKKYLWVILATFTCFFYYLWYAHTNLIFVLILMFLIRCFWDKKLDWNKEDVIFVLILILPQIWYLYKGPVQLYDQVKTLVFNIKNPSSVDILFKDFPNIFMSISELQRLSFKEVIENVTFSLILGILGLIGIIIAFLCDFRKLIFLFPFLGIGFLSFVSGARFVMYLAPFIGIGLGFIVHFLFVKIMPYLSLFNEKEKQSKICHLVGSGLFIITLLAQRPVLGLTSYPKVFAPLVKDMEYIKIHTPKNSAIWTWWDYGYAFQLYSRRTTFHDGGSQGTPKTYFIARSFTTSDPKEAWYITSFISNLGLKGVAEELKKGIKAKDLVKDIREGRYAKEIKTPVYWIFTRDLISKFAWIHYFGSYNFDKKRGIFARILTPHRCEFLNNILYCQDIGAKIDLENGVIFAGQKVLAISKVYIKDQKKLKEKKFFDRGYVIEIIKVNTNQVALFIMDSKVANTLFNKMFILRQYNPKYFKLVLDDFPIAVIYKVKSRINK
ncbi:STT3 domain-containing protein [Thermodesulfobacterium hydrogeniphilum]|uniref:STT3 domain-containing protein n=1 Tax=Thermodesulfobacterium hydrogeniphilum TaxID=161156 RepID=UPI00056E7A33|nr:STT3 domain-containing protein [Thermodesulfobacterium hydrogeniphilum]